MTIRAWIDRVVGPYALLALREATGREDPLPHILPPRALALRPATTIALWSLVGGVGTSTLAALLAHRSTSARSPTLLVDLDRRAPALALRARIEAATVADALLRPGREAELVSRWAATPFLPGAPGLERAVASERIVAMVRRAAGGRAAVLDLGSGAEGLDRGVLAACDRLVVCVGTRIAQLQAAFCSVALLAPMTIPIGVAVIGAEADDAAHIAGRLPWPLLGAIPHDERLAADEFAARGPTLHSVDRLIGRLA